MLPIEFHKVESPVNPETSDVTSVSDNGGMVLLSYICSHKWHKYLINIFAIDGKL